MDSVASVCRHCVAKVERRGRTTDEVDQGQVPGAGAASLP